MCNVFIKKSQISVYDILLLFDICLINKRIAVGLPSIKQACSPFYTTIKTIWTYWLCQILFEQNVKKFSHVAISHTVVDGCDLYRIGNLSWISDSAGIELPKKVSMHMERLKNNGRLFRQIPCQYSYHSWSQHTR